MEVLIIEQILFLRCPMKILALVIAIYGTVAISAPQLFAQAEPEPTTYVVQKGDTLWDITERFFKDPFFWPNLWSKNPFVGNPHFIYPGQKLHIYPDRIEIAPSVPPQQQPVADIKPLPASSEQIREKTFQVVGSEGFIEEHDLNGVGRIIATNNQRVIVGTGDMVYTNIGAGHGARKGDRFSIFSKEQVVIHPLRHDDVGYKIVPLGTLELTELTPTGSRAYITQSYREISSGAILLPWHEGRHEIPLKAASSNISGIILQTFTGNKAVGIGDVIYLDQGKDQGVALGNMFYVVRQPVPDKKYREGITLPQELVGALVIIGISRNTSTALIVKNVDSIYLGDMVVSVAPP
jgi:LysM repeat protein